MRSRQLTLQAEIAKSRSCLRRLRSLTDGQDLIEYALLLALISATVLITVTELGGKVPGFYAATAAALPGGKPADDPGNGDPGNGNPGNGNPGNGNPGNGNPNPGNGNPGNGNPNPGGGNPGNGNPNPGNGNPGNGNPNPGGGNPGGGNPGGGKGK